MEQHLLNPEEFWTPHPLPTVAKNEIMFNPNGFWRGPTWIATNWFIYHGLLNYGFSDIANELKTTCVNLIEKSGFREQYHPETGEGYGAQEFTWGTLVVDMENNPTPSTTLEEASVVTQPISYLELEKV
jgi:glycogen debranching enzyme